MIRFDKLTLKAQEAFQSAQDIAARHDQQQVEPLHLLGALVAQQDGVVPPLLARLGVRPETLAGEIEQGLGRFPKVTGAAQQHLSPAANKVLEGAFVEAETFKRFHRTYFAGDRDDPERSGGRAAGQAGRFARSDPAGADFGPREPPRNFAKSGIDFPRAGTVRV